RAPGALVDPDEQRERRHRGADLRHELAGPDDEKRAHGSPYYTIGRRLVSAACGHRQAPHNCLRQDVAERGTFATPGIEPAYRGGNPWTYPVVTWWLQAHLLSGLPSFCSVDSRALKPTTRRRS